MGLKDFSIESLPSLDGGRAAIAWEQALARALDDIIDRPGNDQARKVVLQLSLVPVVDEAGDVETVKGQFNVKEVIPQRNTKFYSFGCRRDKRGPRLVFNEDSLDNHQQGTLLEDE